MKVLVTGGAGYIGSILVRLLLEKGYTVGVLDRFFFGKDSIKNIENLISVYKDDVRTFNPSILNGYDAVIDMAAISNDPSGELDPNKTLEINYLGRKRVSELAKKHGVKRYILASSCSVYGFQDEIINEKSTTNPLTTYAKANILAERTTTSIADTKFCVTILRQATVYGFSPRMRFDLAVNGMVKGFYLNKKIPIMRDGKQWRPFVHVKDTAKAFIEALEADSTLVNGEIFNVGTDEQNVQIFDLAKNVAEAIGYEFIYEWYGSPDNRSYRVSFNKIKNILKFKPEMNLKVGANEVYMALVDKQTDPHDQRTITMSWYKNLIEMEKTLSEIKLNNRIL